MHLFFILCGLRYLFNCFNYRKRMSVGTIMFGGGKEEGGVMCDLADGSAPLQTGPQARHCVNGFAHLAQHQHSLVQPRDVWHRQPLAETTVLTAVGNRTLHLSTRGRSLQQLGWRRAPYKGCPRKREQPSAGTRAKIIHVGLGVPKKTSADILSFLVTFLSPAVIIVRPKLKNNRKGRRLVR